MPRDMAHQFGARASFASFAAALEEGTQQLNRHMGAFEGDDPQYQVISLSEARQFGILPLAYGKSGTGRESK